MKNAAPFFSQMDSTSRLLWGVAFVLYFLQCPFQGYAQQYNFENYGVDNGFPATAYRIFQDSRGYLWLGTDGQGICKFDGYSKTYYTKPDGLAGNTVRSIVEDKYNRLWFATDEGISIFNGLTFRSIKENDGLSSNVVVTLYIDKYGNVIAGTAGEKGGVNKISIVSPDSVVISVLNKDNGLTVNSVFTIYQDSWGRYWIGTFGGGINVVSSDFNKVQRYYTTVEGFPSNYIISFSKSSDNILWAGTYDKGVVSVEVNENIHQCNLKTFCDENITVWDVLPLNQTLWYGTNLNGLIGKSGNSIISINERNGLRKNQVVDLFCDRENSLWVASFDGGISRFLGRRFITYTKDDALFIEDITSLKVDRRGTAWMGSYSNGLYAVDYINGKIVSKYEGLKGHVIYSIDIDKENNKWIATNNGVYKYNGRSFNAYNQKNSGIINDNVSCILVDRANAIWCGTPKGISVFDGQKFRNTKEGYLPNTEVQTIIQDGKENVWCGTLGGLVKFHNDSITSFDEQEGLMHKKIYSLAVDANDNLWIGTLGGGIYKLCVKASRAGNDTIVRLPSSDQLTSLNILSLQFINSKYLVVGTDKGLNKIYIGQSELADTVFRYSIKEGFTGVKCNQNVISLVDASVWIGTSKGLTVYNPSFDVDSKIIPKIHVTNIKLFFKNIDWIKMGFSVSPWSNLPRNLLLSHSQNHLTFEFTGILFFDKEEIKYRYKLEGLDKEWSPPMTKTEALYSSLSPGKYSFKVMASNRYGQWSEPATFSFTIKPPFWQTIWFFIIVSIAVIASIVFYIKYREQKLKNERDRLEQIVKERTREIVEQKKEITESIEYAKRLQSAIITSDDALKVSFPDSFILFKPKDIVSGDFYWYGKYNNRIILIAADCTGHGVPGAFMSMLGVSLLNKIIAEERITSPDDVLNKLRDSIIKSLKQSEYNNIQDGMDMVMLSFNEGLDELEFCGANNPMFILREKGYFNESVESAEFTNESFYLVEVKGQKMPVSISRRMDLFSKETIRLYPNDRIYIFSDGYEDQIGGPNKKKFMKKQFKQLLLEISTLPMGEQKLLLDARIREWIGDGQQLDDIMVLGVACK